MKNPDRKFWEGKRVLITGHTGFKGGWLSIWLHSLGAEVFGISLEPDKIPNLYAEANLKKISFSHYVDIRDYEKLKTHIKNINPEIVFHLAAQPLVRKSYIQPLETFSTNIMGTANVLEAIRNSKSVKSALMITTDKVYSNNEWLWPYRESDRIGGSDPYSASKSGSEIVIESYKKSFYSSLNINIAIARAGNVFGGGDWSEDRLMPDVAQAWLEGKNVEIRNPNSVRPWQHVLEPLSGYLLLAESMTEYPDRAGSYNFGPGPSGEISVIEFISKTKDAFKNFGRNGQYIIKRTIDEFNESNLLRLDVSKAQAALNYFPRWGVDLAIQKTAEWYIKKWQGDHALELCQADIKSFEALNEKF